MTSIHSHRKDEHVSLAQKFNSDTHSSFDQVRITNQIIPDFGIADINLATDIAGVNLNMPFYIEAISGGSPTTKKINQRLANIAAQTGIAMAVGSQSVALKQPELADSFTIVRQANPQGVVIANIGADKSVAAAQAAVDMIAADLLEVHINVTQELIMPEGDRQFNFLQNIQEIVNNVTVPVIVKEVGFGMNQDIIQQLLAVGVQNINVSGTSGTNFAKIENFRRPAKEMTYLEDWGLTTVESLLEAQELRSQFNLIASGGITTPLDVVKALCLGSKAVGMAGAFLNYVIKYDDDQIIQLINNFKYGIKSIMLMMGAKTITDLQQTKLLLSPELISYVNQRNIEY